MDLERERERVLSIINSIFICTLESRRRIPPGERAVYAYPPSNTHTNTRTHAGLSLIYIHIVKAC